MADYLESEKVRQRWLRYLETGHKEPAERMMATYKRTLRTIEDEVKPLIRRLAAANRTGDASEVAALSTRLSLAYSRAESVRQAITSTIERSGLAQVTNEQITKLAPKAFAEGAALGYERLKGAGVDFQRINNVAVEQAVGRLRRGTNAYEWVQAFAGAQGKDAARSLARSVALGHGVERMTREFSRSLSGAGAHRIETFVRTEMIGAMREGNLTTYRANRDLVQGWVWNATASACAVCQGMNGSVHGLDEMMFSHPRCRCSADPITKPFSELGAAGVEDTASTGFDPNGPFSLLADSEQRRILGPGRFRRYKDGGLDLRDIPARTNHPRWGPGLRSKTLAELDRGGLERVPVTPAGASKPSPPSVVETVPPPPPSTAPWLDQLEEIAARHEGADGTDYGLDKGLWADYYRARNEARMAPRLGDVRETRQAEAQRALDAVMGDMDSKVDDVLAAGRVIEEELERRVALRGGYNQELIEIAERSVRDAQRRLDALEGEKGKGVKQAKRDARFRLRAAEGRLAQAREGQADIVREELIGLLGEARPMGFTPQQRTAFRAAIEQRANPKVLESVERMSRFMPSGWLEQMVKWAEGAAAEGHKMRLQKADRGYFSEGGYVRPPELRVSYWASSPDLNPGDSTALHEMTHWAETALEEMRALEWAYYQRRTTVRGSQEKTVSLKTAKPGHGYQQWEKAREDQWADLYMGKDYGNDPTSFYEVATMGIESAMRTSQRPSIDPEHRRFIYGLLALLRRA